MKTIYPFMTKITVKTTALIFLLLFTKYFAKAECPIDSSFSFVDLGNNSYQFTANQPQNALVHYTWSFGDGNNAYDKQVTNTFQFAGTYDVWLFVTDSSITNNQSCFSSSMQQITINNSLPCNVVNDTITDEVYLRNNSNTSIYCLLSSPCLQIINYFGLNNTVHGNISSDGTNCITYNYNSAGLDTFTVFMCDTSLNLCKSTFFSININSDSVCNIISEDTIYLSLDTLFYGGYNFSFLYDSTQSQFQPFVLEEWITPTGTLAPNLTFDSIIQLYRYMNSIAAGIYQYDNGVTIYSTNQIAMQYSTIKIFTNTFVLRSVLFNYNINTQASYCSSLQNGRYFFDNNWQYIGLCSPSNVRFNFNQRGIYPISIRDSTTNCTDNVVFIVGDSTQSLCDTTTCLLPGDADHDLTVNNFDVLAVGLSYNRTGNARLNATTQYTLQASPNWNSTHYFGYDDKFADCNGDGIINELDVLVIDQNYIEQEQNIFHHRDLSDTTPVITLTFDSIPQSVVTANCDGAALTGTIDIGNMELPVSDLYGVAFSINYPFESDSCFEVSIELDSASWLQTNDTVLFFYKNIPQYHRVDVALIRTNQSTRSGFGTIGNIRMITEGPVFFNGRISKVFSFSVTDVVAINNIGNKLNLNGSEVDIDFIISATQQHKINGLKWYPNPIKDKLVIQAKENIDEIKVFDLSGKLLNALLINKNFTEIDFSYLQKGMYILEIRSNDTINFEKIIKQ